MEHEETRLPEWCKTCEHWAHDEWYPTEHVCVCKYAEQYGLMTGEDDTCEDWEWNGEDYE